MEQLKSQNFWNEWNNLELLEQLVQNGTSDTKWNRTKRIGQNGILKQMELHGTLKTNLSHCNKDGISGTTRN